MPDNTQMVQRGGRGGGRGSGRPPGGRPPGRRPPGRRPPMFPVVPVRPGVPFYYYPIYYGMPGRQCFYIDEFGRCCDRYGRCCDRFGRCYGGSYADAMPTVAMLPDWYDDYLDEEPNDIDDYDEE